MGSFLRSLSPSAQVGLLFVLLFGLLALASIVLTLWSLRDEWTCRRNGAPGGNACVKTCRPCCAVHG